MEHVTVHQLALAGAMTAVGAMWGDIGWLFILWAICMGLDYLTGSLAAFKNHGWDSEVARAGVWHKAAMITVVLAGMLFDIALNQIIHVTGITLPLGGLLVTPILLSWYIVTEIGSIVENAIKMGAVVPAWLQKGLKIVADGLYKAGEDKTGGGGSDEPRQ